MGTVYYLWREDNRTGYELGKSWELSLVFGQPNTGAAQLLTEPDTLADLIAMVVFEHETHVGDRVLRGFWDDTPENREYVGWIARDIVRWSEGQLVTFENEHSGCVEDAYMEGHTTAERRRWITGSRFPATRLPSC